MGFFDWLMKGSSKAAGAMDEVAETFSHAKLGRVEDEIKNVKFGPTRSQFADVERAHTETNLEKEYRSMGVHKDDSSSYLRSGSTGTGGSGGSGPGVQKAREWESNEDIYKRAMDKSPIGKYAGYGAMFGGAFAVAGSGIYGGTKMVSPNNADVNDPIKNFVKGAMIGVAGGALMAASKGIGFSNIAKMANPEMTSKLTNVEHGARMVNGIAQNKLVQGALAASIVAGSGNVNFTRPINPVY